MRHLFRPSSQLGENYSLKFVYEMTLCSKQNNSCALNEFLSMRIADTGLSWA